jgi:hypothetical protein
MPLILKWMTSQQNLKNLQAGSPCMGKCDTSRPSRVALFSFVTAID